MKKRAHSSYHSSRESTTISLVDLKAGIDDFLLSGEVEGHSPQTLKNRKFLFSKFVEFQEGRGCASCGPRDFTAFLADTLRGHESPAGRWGNPKAKAPLCWTLPNLGI